MNAPKTLLALVALLGAVLVACPGTLEDPGRFGARGSSATPAPSLDSGATTAATGCPDTDLVLAAQCANAGCHSAADRAGELDLASMGVAARVVGVPARTGGLLVNPDAPAESSLYRRLQPTAAGRMPPGGDALDDATVQCFLTWMEVMSADAAPGKTMGEGGTGGATIRIAAGAVTAYTDKAGKIWSADVGAGGRTGVESPPVSIAGTMDPVLYNGQRFGADPVSNLPVPVTYAFDVANGNYQVTLKFAELFTGITAAGQRVFDVVIDGKTVLSAFDIFASAGGRNIAIDRTFEVAVTTGKLKIELVNGAANFAKVSALMIAPR